MYIKYYVSSIPQHVVCSFFTAHRYNIILMFGFELCYWYQLRYILCCKTFQVQHISNIFFLYFVFIFQNSKALIFVYVCIIFNFSSFQCRQVGLIYIYYCSIEFCVYIYVVRGTFYIAIFGFVVLFSVIQSRIYFYKTYIAIVAFIYNIYKRNKKTDICEPACHTLMSQCFGKNKNKNI